MGVNRTERKGESGQAIIFFAVGLALLVTIVAVVTNIGFTTSARTETHQGVGQAAIAGATAYNECPKDSGTVASKVRSRSQEVASQNRVAGAPLTLANSDITLGWMHPVSQVFTALGSSDYHVANAVKIAGQSTPIPLLMTGLLGGSGTTTRSSNAWGVVDGPGILDTGVCLALNDCTLINTLGCSGTNPVNYNVSVRYDTPTTNTGEFWSLSFNPDPGQFAVCPAPTTFPPQFPSPDPDCAIEWLIAHAHVFANLFCLGNPAPPALCSTWIGDFAGNPTAMVRQKIYLQNDFLLPMLADIVSGGNVSNLSGNYVVPVYSSNEITNWMSYDFFGTFPTVIDFPPVHIGLEFIGIDIAGVTIDIRIDFDWPYVPIEMYLSPVVGFAQYEVQNVTEQRETINFSVDVVLESCENDALCDDVWPLNVDCCADYIEPYFPISIDIPLDIVAGLTFNGRILRGQTVDSWGKGGMNFGISATKGTGPLLIEARGP